MNNAQYSLKGVHRQTQAFNECSIQGVQVETTSVQGVFNTDSKAFCALTSDQGVFISDTNENFFMFTPW